jgi:DNA-directed RNA polymerase subunit F
LNGRDAREYDHKKNLAFSLYKELLAQKNKQIQIANSTQTAKYLNRYAGAKPQEFQHVIEEMQKDTGKRIAHGNGVMMDLPYNIITIAIDDIGPKNPEDWKRKT